MRAANGWGIVRSNNEPVPRSFTLSSLRDLRRSIRIQLHLYRSDTARYEIQHAPAHEAERNTPAWAILKFRDEVRRSDVERHTGRNRESVRPQKRHVVRQQYPENRHSAQRRGGENRSCATGARREKQT